MKKPGALPLLLFVFCMMVPLMGAVASSDAASSPTSSPESVPTGVDQNYFADMQGCFLLYNMKTNAFEKVIGEDRCKERLAPCSSFKVPLAVMAFDSGVLKDENVILKWDGRKDSRDEANRDQNAKTWIRDSILWFSQRVTVMMGKEKFQSYLNRFDYGNRDLSAGITEAWVVPPSATSPALKISGYEQVEFMKKLWTSSLPASARAMQITRDITYLETSPKGFKLNGKTGSNFYDKERKKALGWFIAHLARGDQEYIAVTNFSDLNATAEKGYGGPRAKQITKNVLTDLGLW